MDLTPASLNNNDGKLSDSQLPPTAPEVAVRSEALLRFWQPLGEHLGLIALFTVCAAVSAFVLARFYVAPCYRGEALLRPTGVGASTGMAAVGALAGADYASGMMELMASYQAEEYLAILKSYAFSASLVKEFHLGPLLLKGNHRQLSSSKNHAFAESWLTYQIMRAQFDCEYDRLTDNLVLHFVNSDPAVTQEVLEAYVKGLREKLRNRAVQGAKSASASLMDEAQRSDDTMLQKELYEMVARQIERQKLAQVQADFAFTVIEPPVVPAEPFSPRPVLDGVLAAMTTFTLIAMFLVGRELMKAHKIRIRIWPL